MALREEVRRFTKGDTLVSLYAQLVDADGAAIDVTGQTVTFFMASVADGSIKVNGAAAVIVDAAAGSVRYDWASADVDTEGEFWGWFVRTSGGKKAHHPGQGHFLRVVIVKAES